MSLAAELSRAQQRQVAGELVAEIGRLGSKCGRRLRFMEDCGTHTVSIFRAGIRQMRSPFEEANGMASSAKSSEA